MTATPRQLQKIEEPRSPDKPGSSTSYEECARCRGSTMVILWAAAGEASQSIVVSNKDDTIKYFCVVLTSYIFSW
jgi:hypothetical protein